MTDEQTRILESIANLDAKERLAIVERIINDYVPSESFLDGLSDEEIVRLEQSIAQADRGEVSPAADVYARIEKTLHDLAK